MSTAPLPRHLALVRLILCHRDVRRFILTALGVYAGMSAWSLTFKPVDRVGDAIDVAACGDSYDPCLIEIAAE